MSAVKRYLPFLVLAACAAALFPLQAWIDSRVPSDRAAEDALYLSRGESVKSLAIGYDSLLADVYWMRAIQFFGSRVLSDRTVLNNPGGRLDLLYPLLDVATTLDPHAIPPYRFGGFFVHDYVNRDRGRALLEKGVRNNPDDYRLYQDLAYLAWTDGDCATASRFYDEGSAAPNAPAWMKPLGAAILARCGQPDLAYEMLARQYESTDDPRVREELALDIKRFRAVNEVNYLHSAAAAFREQTGAFPTSLAQLVRVLRPQQGAPPLRLGPGGAPLDPDGNPYVYNPATGEVSTDPKSADLPNLRATVAPGAQR
jgi:hypothetical protein